MRYSDKDNYCEQARKYQTVLSKEDTKAKLESKKWDASNRSIKNDRINTKYSCSDSYEMGKIKDDCIYISTTDKQHKQIMDGKSTSADGGLSGYFTDQATIDACSKNGNLNNSELNRKTQIAPYQKNSQKDPSYKPHVDCLRIDHDQLEKKYGTRDFNAAIAKCQANNQFGEGGGNQGYNPHINEMIGNGCLKHDKANSYSDASLSSYPDKLNSKPLTDSKVDRKEYRKMMGDAKRRSTDCEKNNTKNPSDEIVARTGYEHNPDPIKTKTGNAEPIIQDKENRAESDSKVNNDNIKEKNSGENIQKDEGPSTTNAKPQEKGEDKGKDIQKDEGPSTTNVKPQEKGEDKGKDIQKGEGPSTTNVKPQEKGEDKSKDIQRDEGPSTTNVKPQEKGEDKSKDIQKDGGPSTTNVKSQGKGEDKNKDIQKDGGPSTTNVKPQEKGEDKNKDIQKDGGPSTTNVKSQGKGEDKNKDIQKDGGPSTTNVKSQGKGEDTPTNKKDSGMSR